MNLNILLGLLIVATLAVTYLFWVRPLLKATPSLGYLYADEERFWRAVKAKLDGLKQKLLTAFITASVFIVTAYDTLAPMVASAGVDVTKITDKIPQEAWPVIGLALVLVMGYFRKVGERSLLTKIATGQATVVMEAPSEDDAAKGKPPAPVVIPAAPGDVVLVPVVVPPVGPPVIDRGNVANS